MMAQKTQLIDLPYNTEGNRATMTKVLPIGDLKTVDYVELEYEEHDILCLETLRLSDPDSNIVLNIIQDYDAHAYDVNTGNQRWESLTGKKITYFSNNCEPDWRMLSQVSTESQHYCDKK